MEDGGARRCRAFFSVRNKTVGKLLFFAGLANFKALLERWVFSMSKIFLTRSQYRYIRTRKLGTLGDADEGVRKKNL